MNFKRLAFNKLLYLMLIILFINAQVKNSVESTPTFKTTNEPEKITSKLQVKDSANSLGETIVKSNSILVKNPPFSDEGMLNDSPATNEILNRRSSSKTKGTLNSVGGTKCRTIACKTEASRLLYYMDHSAENKNIYDYACGGFKDRPEISETDPNQQVKEIIRGELNKVDGLGSNSDKNLREFYQSCINYRHVSLNETKKNVKEILNSFGLKFMNKKEEFNVTHTIASLIQLDSFPLFHVGLEVDHNNSSQLALRLSLSNEDYIFDIENEQQIKCRNTVKNLKENFFTIQDFIDNYKKCLNDYYGITYEQADYLKDIRQTLIDFQVFESDKNSSTLIEETIAEVNRFVREFQFKLPSEQTSYVKYYKVKEIAKMFEKVNWKVLFGILLNRSVRDDENVQVYGMKSDWLDVNDYFEEKNLWKFNNALIAHFTFKMNKYLVKLENSGSDKENFCVEITSRLAPDVVSNLLVNKVGVKTLGDQHNEIKRVSELVRNTLLEEVKVAAEDSNSWLDEESVTTIQKKISSFKVVSPMKLNYNDEFNFEKTFMGNNNLINAIKLLKRKQRLIFSLHNMGSSLPEVIWMLYARPYSKSSVYIYELNTLAVPQAILLEHHKEFPNAITMARLGHVIADGLSRGFDTKGMEFDHENKKKDYILTANSHYTFELTALSIKNTGLNITSIEDDKAFMLMGLSDLLLNELLSDITATALAFKTLIRYGRTDPETLLWGDFSKEQLYLLTLTQKFCLKNSSLELLNFFEKDSFPPHIRVKNIFSDATNFTSTFPLLQQTNNLDIRTFPFLIKHAQGRNEV